VEIRNPELVTASFYEMLRELGVAPAFSLWTKMPSITEQWNACLQGGGVAPGLPYVGIGLTRPGRSYEESVRLFQPYREIKDIYAEAREELAILGGFALQEGRKAYLLLNNRLEGSAPHSVGAVAELIRQRKRV